MYNLTKNEDDIEEFKKDSLQFFDFDVQIMNQLQQTLIVGAFIMIECASSFFIEKFNYLFKQDMHKIFLVTMTNTFLLFFIFAVNEWVFPFYFFSIGVAVKYSFGCSKLRTFSSIIFLILI